MNERRTRVFTDADIEALVDCLEGRLTKRFYLNLGRGIWGVFWKAILTLIVAVSVYGAYIDMTKSAGKMVIR